MECKEWSVRSEVEWWSIEGWSVSVERRGRVWGVECGGWSVWSGV